jgi:putative NIF3 family GTP cyclohydrolase 1 type 2
MRGEPRHCPECRAGTAAAGCRVADLAARAAAALGVSHVQIAGDAARPAGRVGIVCGSGGDCVDQVARSGCDTLFTGEIKLHQATEAMAAGMDNLRLPPTFMP